MIRENIVSAVFGSNCRAWHCVEPPPASIAVSSVQNSLVLSCSVPSPLSGRVPATWAFSKTDTLLISNSFPKNWVAGQLL